MNGQIRQIGSPEEVFSSPVDEEVASFVGAGNVLQGVVSVPAPLVVTIDVKGGQVQAVSRLGTGSNVTVYLHYEDITISLPASDTVASSARNQLRGRITRLLPVGSQLRVSIDCGLNLTAIITRHSEEELGLETGLEVIASFKASSVHLIPRC